MPTRFRRTVKIAPGVRFNIGKKSGSVSIGKRGASMNFGKRGVYGNVGLPGTGLSYRSKLVGSSQNGTKKSKGGEPISSSEKVEIPIQISLLDDGSITFRNEKGESLPDEWIRKAKSQNRELILNWLQEHCQEKNEDIYSLLNIHLSTPSPDTEISFIPASFDKEEPTPPSDKFDKPKPNPPKLKESGFLASKSDFIRNRIKKSNLKVQEKYEEALRKWQSEKDIFEANYEEKKSKYLKELEKFNKLKDEFIQQQESQKKFIEEDRLHDVEAMNRFLGEVLQTIIWPKETLMSFEVVNEGSEVFMDVDLPEIEDMPEMEAIVNKRDFSLASREISDTQKRKNYFTHVHAIGFRLIGEVFVSLPSVKTVVFSGYSQRVSKKTGNLTDEYLYSVKVSRDHWEKINFENLELIDVVKSFELFNLRRNATKTGIMRLIEPFK